MSSTIDTTLREYGLKIATIEGKGKGLVAERPIKKGEIVLTEKPLIIQGMNRDNETVKKALAKCSKAEQRAFLSLHNRHSGSKELFRDIFDTNAWPCGPNGREAGLYLVASRFNSSCTPSANNFWNQKLGRIEFRATRDIAVGEEISVNYGSSVDSRNERQIHLKEKFVFDCTCETCSLKGAALQDSEDRREYISIMSKRQQQLIRRLTSPNTKHRDYISALAEVSTTLKFLKQENLPVHESDFYYHGYCYCAIVGDSKHAKEWAKKAYEIGLLMSGEEWAAEDLGYMNNPASHPFWGLGRRDTLVGPEMALRELAEKGSPSELVEKAGDLAREDVNTDDCIIC